MSVFDARFPRAYKAKAAHGEPPLRVDRYRRSKVGIAPEEEGAPTILPLNSVAVNIGGVMQPNEVLACAVCAGAQ